jgi:hypothetical protein
MATPMLVRLRPSLLRNGERRRSRLATLLGGDPGAHPADGTTAESVSTAAPSSGQPCVCQPDSSQLCRLLAHSILLSVRRLFRAPPQAARCLARAPCSSWCLRAWPPPWRPWACRCVAGQLCSGSGRATRASSSSSRVLHDAARARRLNPALATRVDGGVMGGESGATACRHVREDEPPRAARLLPRGHLFVVAGRDFSPSPFLFAAVCVPSPACPAPPMPIGARQDGRQGARRRRQEEGAAPVLRHCDAREGRRRVRARPGLRVLRRAGHLRAQPEVRGVAAARAVD